MMLRGNIKRTKPDTEMSYSTARTLLSSNIAHMKNMTFKHYPSVYDGIVHSRCISYDLFKGDTMKKKKGDDQQYKDRTTLNVVDRRFADRKPHEYRDYTVQKRRYRTRPDKSFRLISESDYRSQKEETELVHIYGDCRKYRRVKLNKTLVY